MPHWQEGRQGDAGEPLLDARRCVADPGESAGLAAESASLVIEREPGLAMRRGDCGHRGGRPDFAPWARDRRKLASWCPALVAHSMRGGTAAAGHPARYVSLRRAAGPSDPGAGWSWEGLAARVNPGVEAGINPESHPWADAADGCLEAL
jgi:hypothetical protein